MQQKCWLTACFRTKSCAEEMKWLRGQWETVGAAININIFDFLFLAAAATLCKSERETIQSRWRLWLKLSFELDDGDGQQLSPWLKRQKENSQLNKDTEHQ